MHLDKYEIQKICTNFNVLSGRSNAPNNLSQAEISSLSNVRDMEFGIWYNHVQPTSAKANVAEAYTHEYT